MAYIIICVVIAFIIGYMDYNDFEDGILGAFVGLAIGGILFFFVGGWIGNELPQKEIVTEQQIYALNDSTSTEGRKYLFSGYIDEDLVYRYVASNDKGKYIEEIKDDDDTYNPIYIKEGNYTPALKHFSYKLEKDWHKLFAHADFKNTKDECYIFYVPEGTVTNEYNINLN